MPELRNILNCHLRVVKPGSTLGATRLRSTPTRAAYIVALAMVASACLGSSDSVPAVPLDAEDEFSAPTTTGRPANTSVTAGNSRPANTVESDARSDVVAASRVEQSEAIAECAALQGVDVAVDPSGDGVTWRAPEGQEATVNSVVDACATEVAQRFGVVSGEPSREDLEHWYEAYLLTYECMTELGYPSEPPPSIDAYVDSEGMAWHPYSAVMTNSQGEIRPGEPFSENAFRTLESLCPQDLTYLLTQIQPPSG